ncbi:nuclear receptor-interacting protein 3 isoform X3 [Xenopus tropicalis]|uniref:Nuclear receptor-interacting protein 3 isoform X3 n=1 Tax=Xenopus tropicalis TaxID=8364 RepID=A0A8J1J8W5_XENTR|nr:nuclear receptor-interacting protein 3 isoform X3 [Xenopus tropicalis]
MQGLGRDTQNRDSPKREKDLRGSAILHQQRRLKQATQFVHKDSADLLPLDQLQRLGTSKDLQPHSVIQRRLMGGSLSIESDNPVFPTSPCNRGRDAPPQGDETIQPTKLGEETPGGWKEQALLIPCKVCGHDARAKLCTEHQQNLISRSCTERLGAPISHYKVASGLYGPRNDTDWSLEFTSQGIPKC